MQQRRQAQALDGPPRLRRPDRGDECDLVVAQLGVDASGAHDDDRAEGGVAGHADEQLEAVSRT